jgi:thymidylate kinase
MNKGKLIVIEGTDGSGKATQTGILIKTLADEGRKVSKADFPRYGQRSAAMVEDYLNGKFGSANEVGPYRGSIFYAIDRYAASFDIKKSLDAGEIVVCNRYVSANMGHQAGKIKDDAEKDRFLAWLEDLEFGIFGIPKPDVVFLLLMPVEVGQLLVDKKGQRNYTAGRDIHEADLAHLKDAENAYRYCAAKYGWQVIECAAGNTIESVRKPGDIAKEIREKMKKILEI